MTFFSGFYVSFLKGIGEPILLSLSETHPSPFWTILKDKLTSDISLVTFLITEQLYDGHFHDNGEMFQVTFQFLQKKRDYIYKCEHRTREIFHYYSKIGNVFSKLKVIFFTCLHSVLYNCDTECSWWKKLDISYPMPNNLILRNWGKTECGTFTVGIFMLELPSTGKFTL